MYYKAHIMQDHAPIRFRFLQQLVDNYDLLYIYWCKLVDYFEVSKQDAYYSWVQYLFEGLLIHFIFINNCFYDPPIEFYCIRACRVKYNMSNVFRTFRLNNFKQPFIDRNLVQKQYYNYLKILFFFFDFIGDFFKLLSIFEKKKNYANKSNIHYPLSYFHLLNLIQICV